MKTIIFICILKKSDNTSFTKQAVVTPPMQWSNLGTAICIGYQFHVYNPDKDINTQFFIHVGFLYSTVFSSF